MNERMGTRPVSPQRLWGVPLRVSRSFAASREWVHSRSRHVAVGVAALALIPVLVGCGGGNEGTGAGPVPTAARAATLPAGAPLIDQDKMEFIPTELKVQSGTTVYLKNSEATVHTVTIEGKNVSGTMKKDDLLAWNPPAPGTYKVTCDFHPLMKATITVK